MKHLFKLLIPLILLSVGLTYAGKGSKTVNKSAPVVDKSQTETVGQESRGAGWGSPTPATRLETTTNFNRTGEQISRWVIAAGGNRGSSSSWQVANTTGQTVAGGGTSPSFSCDQGFWFGENGCCQNAGDFNGDGNNDVSDLSGPNSLVAFMFLGGPPPDCSAEGDFNGDGNQDVSDLSGPTSMVAFMFLGGPPPVCGP